MADYYDVDLLGQDGSGRVSGLHPMYGAAIGSGLGTATSELVQFTASGKLRDHAEGIALGVVGSAALLMGFFVPSMRGAAWAMGLSAIANNGVRYLIDLLMPSTDQALQGYALQALNGAYNLEALNGAYNLEQLSAPSGYDVLNAPAAEQVLNAPGYQEMSRMASAFGVTGI
jgi:hypothetical protein